MINTLTRTKLIIFSIIAIIVFIIYNIDKLSLIISGDFDALEQLSHGSVIALLLITFVLTLIQNLFPILPLLLLISLNVSLFGLYQGYIWSWFISNVGAIIAFIIARYGFQDYFGKYMNDKIKLRIENHGFWFVLIGRLLPYMPSSLVNIAAGGSSVRFSNFIYAVLIGNTLYYFFLYLISQGLLTIIWDLF